MSSSIESCRLYFKKIFFPNSEFDYKDFIKRLTIFFNKPENIKYLKYKQRLIILANAYYLKAGSEEEWNYLTTELKNFCGYLKDPNYVYLVPQKPPIKPKKNFLKKKSKSLVYLPTGRRRKRFGSGRNRLFPVIISGGINQ